MTDITAKAESWGSRVGLILAMAGNAVGLGNFLRFPVQAIQNGGGAFIIPYLVCFLLMGIPLLFVEWSMGRFGGKFGHHSTPFILDSMDKRAFWKYVGVFGIFTNLAVAAYYCYLESWTLSYVYHSIMRDFSGDTQAQVAQFFVDYTGSPSGETYIFWILCLVLNTWILSRGLSGGVEKVAKIGMPLLILFGVFLAIMAYTVKAGTNGAINDGTVGLNYLWTPDFSTIWTPKVWMAAAGQIFFTLSVGMGSIQCYASYVKPKEDIALNAMSAGWMNEFVEVVLGSAIIIPISVGYLGIDKVVEMTTNGGLGLGFQTLPYLFEQWGSTLAVICGVFWFGLLFFAGITSSLAMGTPCMGFLQDEFGWKRENAAWAFGGVVFLLGLPTVLFFNYGVFDEYDYWAGTFSLVVFAMIEIILFAWVFGMEKGWKEITTGADIQIPVAFKFIIQYVTPILLAGVFISNIPDLVKKVTNADVYEEIVDVENVINGMPQSEITAKAIAKARAKVADIPEKEAKAEEKVKAAAAADAKALAEIIDKDVASGTSKEIAETKAKATIKTVAVAKKAFLEKKIIYVNMARILLLAVFAGVSYLVYVAYEKRKREGRIS